MKKNRNRNQNYIVSFDRIALICYLTLCVCGFLLMANLAFHQKEPGYFYRHAVFMAISIASCMIILIFFNLEKLKFLNIYLVVTAIILLGLVLVIGVTVKGGTRSLRLGPFSFQPSFFARVALILYLASLLAKNQKMLQTANVKELFLSFYPFFIMALMVYGLIILERHLSTLVISGMTVLTVFIFAGLRMRYVLFTSLIGVVIVFGIISFGAKFRSSRIETYRHYFLLTRSEDNSNALNDDYQVKESITALIRGGWTGTGIHKGMAKHSYLPESRTDYIYTIVGEEFGFFGALFIFALHCLLFFRALKIANEEESPYLKYLCAGLALNIFFNVLVNTGVAISILPATGTTLPFISYGGTALLIDSASVGVILNISARRRQL